ncbi:serine/threonine protein kinase [Cytobacillus pseudoceanisediminis]|uniref:serine/threonine protein kinase n=1 Tax=Cytobacillus pseudoceanisediminis TaxID=3051614 RepID=UPI003CFAFEB2
MSDYQERYKKEREEQLSLWKEMVEGVFGESTKESVKITDKNRIIEVLNAIGSSQASNHTFMPSGGGLDLSSAKHSSEQGLLELNFDESAIIVNPESLTFHAVGDDPDWWYFRLNTLPFAKSGVYEDYEDEEEQVEQVFKSSSQQSIEEQMKFYGEEVLEIEPGKYVDRSFWDIDHLGYDHNGNLIPLPKDARVITRKFNGGDFVTFSKYALYNQVPATYDGRHAKVSDEKFHEYIVEIVEGLKRRQARKGQ